MENIKLPVKKIRRAEIRYFETDKNACEIPDIKAYSYFLDADGTYVNIFHPTEECNVYKRVPYPNFTQAGETFGTKIKLVDGQEEDGVCYILSTNRLEYPEEYISIKDFAKLIIRMDEFVVDRIDLINNSDSDILTKLRYLRLIKRDLEDLIKLQDYINSKEKEKIYKKS